MKFAIFGNTYQAKKSKHAETLFRLLEQRNARLCICREFYNFLTSDLHMDIASAELFDGNDFIADMVISIGGDGTFLKAASRVGRRMTSAYICDMLTMKSTIIIIRWRNAAYYSCIAMTRI